MDLGQHNAKKDLIALLDKIPDKEIKSVKRYLEFLIAVNRFETENYDHFEEFLSSLPVEDITDIERKRINRLSSDVKKQFKKGRTTSLKRLKQLNAC